jgi:hypothetical protein
MYACLGIHEVVPSFEERADFQAQNYNQLWLAAKPPCRGLDWLTDFI